MDAALEEQGVRVNPLPVFRMVGAPGDDIMKSMGRGIGRTVRTRLQVKGDFPHHQVWRHFHPLIVFQQHGQHIPRNIFFRNFSGCKVGEQQLAPGQ